MKNKTIKLMLAAGVLVVCCGVYMGVKNYVSSQEVMGFVVWYKRRRV